MIALFCYLALFQDKDVVSSLYRTQAMGDDNDGLALLGEHIQSRLHIFLRYGVERRRSFVKYQDGRILI